MQNQKFTHHEFAFAKNNPLDGSCGSDSKQRYQIRLALV
jgi:hypothetical protein